jgi:NADPH:quinone reductase-like Zn-dependent oxidoreductase
MELRYKILNTLLLLVFVAVISIGVVLSYTSPCPPPANKLDDPSGMRAVVSRCYGAPEGLEVQKVAKPVPADNELLVRVHAAAANPLDWHYMRGSPYIMRMGTGIGRPTDIRMGVDFAGTVESVGKDVTGFEAGDEVFGGTNGAFAEYLAVSDEEAVVLKPSNMAFPQAASVAIAGVTALQALRDKGRVRPGDKVLINGASGGVGTFAVQIAKTMGAEVTGVCSTRNVEMVRGIGADHVIDYKNSDYTQGAELYDVIIDNVGNHSISANRKVLKPTGRFVIVGGGKGNWLGPLMQPIKAMLMAPFVDQKLGMFIAQLNQDDLKFLAGLMQSGQVTPVIDREYSLAQTAEAIAYLEEGRARGKVVILVH